VRDVLGSPGRPLDPATRASVEPRVGHDFGRVRVHTDARASESARALRARAYTVGRNVVFAPGQYALDTDRGQRLLKHELTHVVQQDMVGASAPTGAIYRQAELEAARVSAASVGGAPVRISLGIRPGTLQAQSEEEQPWYEETGEWVLGAIGGEFIDEPTFGQIGADFVLSVIPVVDQVADARDLAAHVYRLGIRGEHGRWDRWVALVFTLIGLVPEVGSVIKSLSRAALRGVSLVLENIGEILRLARRVIPVDVSDAGRLQRYVMENWSSFVEVGMNAWNRLLAGGDELVAKIPRLVGDVRQAVHNRLATLHRVSSEMLPRAFENVRNTIRDVLDRVREQLGLGRSSPIAGATDQEIGAALEDISSPRVTGGAARPRIEGHPVPTTQRTRLDIEAVPRQSGETIAQTLARVRRVIGQKLSDIPSVNAAWNRARAHVLQTRTLDSSNYEELYNLTRNRFWQEVRGESTATRYFTDAGFDFLAGPTTAPVLRNAGTGIPVTETRISLDHLAEKSIGNNWTKALDADNLQMEFAMPNTFREIVQARHPELR